MDRNLRAPLTSLLLLAALGLAGAVPAVAADRTVSMRDNRYVPVSVTIRPGDTVTWSNDGALPHDAAGNGWGTELLDPGGRDAVRFTRSGTYRYQCTIHAEMRGTIVVRAAGSGATIPPTDAAGPVDPVPASGDATPLAIVAAGLLGLMITMRRLRPTRG